MHLNRSVAAAAVLALFTTAAYAQSTTNPPGRSNVPGPDTAGLTACMGVVGAARDDCMRSLPSSPEPATSGNTSTNTRAGGTSSSPKKGLASGGEAKSNTGTSSSPAAGTADRGGTMSTRGGSDTSTTSNADANAASSGATSGAVPARSGNVGARAGTAASGTGGTAGK